MTATRPYNPFDHLLTEADLGDYLSQAFMDEDSAVFITALGHIARKRGGARVIYFNLSELGHIVLVTLYAKNQQATLQPGDIPDGH